MKYDMMSDKEGRWYLVECDNDRLSHARGKGQPRPNHKYTRREWRNGQWYYYYDNDNDGRDDNTGSPVDGPVTWLLKAVTKPLFDSIEDLARRGEAAVWNILHPQKAEPETKSEYPIGQNYGSIYDDK